MKALPVRLFFVSVLGTALLAAPQAIAADRHHVEDSEAIVIRRTIPYPRAVERAPLTSDRLSTTSTRYIDARRGHRPYSTVHGHAVGYGHRVRIGYDDNFGITRPEDRPYSYARRTPATGVTQYVKRGPKPQSSAREDESRSTPMVVIIRDERGAAATDRVERRSSDMQVRIHNNKPELPTRSGAVIITADGTVIQVGD